MSITLEPGENSGLRGWEDSVKFVVRVYDMAFCRCFLAVSKGFDGMRM